MKKWFSQNKWLLAVSIFLILIWAILYVSEFAYKKSTLTVIGYLVIYTVVALMPENKATDRIRLFVSFPLIIFLFIKPLFGVIFFSLITSYLPFIIFFWVFFIALNLLNITYTNELLWYLSFLTASIFLVEFFEFFLEKVFKMLPKISVRKRLKSKLELTKLLVTNKRVRIIIYGFYLLFLLAFSIVKIMDYPFDGEFLQASFYAFATFLAYDRLRQQDYKKIKIEWKEVLKKMYGDSVFNDDTISNE